MNKPPRIITKPLAQRMQDLVESLLVARDCLRQVRDGKTYHAMPVAAQLRALVADSTTRPLLVHLADFLGREIRLFVGPGLPPATDDSDANTRVIEVAEVAVTPHRTNDGQREVSLGAFLAEPIIRFEGRKYTRAKFIKMMAQQAGGAHLAPDLEEVLAALLAVGSNGRPLAHDIIVQMAECLVQCGAEMLRSLCEFSLHSNVLLAAAPADHGGVLFDYVYPATSMRLLVCHAPTGHLRCVLIGVNGMSATLEVEQLVDWSIPRWLSVQQEINRDLQTTLRLTVDGAVIGTVTVDHPVFVDGDLSKFDRYVNRSHESEVSGSTLAVLRTMILSGPVNDHALSLIDRAFRSQRETKDDAHVFLRGGWGHDRPGTRTMSCHGPVFVWAWRRLVAGELPAEESAVRVVEWGDSRD